MQGQAQLPMSNLPRYTPSFAQEQAATQANMAAGRQTMAGNSGNTFGASINPAMAAGVNPLARAQLPNQGPMVSRPPQQQQQPSYFGITPPVAQNAYQAQMLGRPQQQPYMQQNPYANALHQFMMNQQQQYGQSTLPQYQQPQYQPQFQQSQYQRPFLFGTNMNSPIMNAPWFNNMNRQPLQPGQYGYGNGVI